MKIFVTFSFEEVSNRIDIAGNRSYRIWSFKNNFRQHFVARFLNMLNHACSDFGYTRKGGLSTSSVQDIPVKLAFAQFPPQANKQVAVQPAKQEPWHGHHDSVTSLLAINLLSCFISFISFPLSIIPSFLQNA